MMRLTCGVGPDGGSASLSTFILFHKNEYNTSIAEYNVSLCLVYFAIKAVDNAKAVVRLSRIQGLLRLASYLATIARCVAGLGFGLVPCFLRSANLRIELKHLSEHGKRKDDRKRG